MKSQFPLDVLIGRAKERAKPNIILILCDDMERWGYVWLRAVLDPKSPVNSDMPAGTFDGLGSPSYPKIWL